MAAPLQPTVVFSKRTQISEQIWRMVEGGVPSSDSSYDLREIELLVDQAINYNVKLALYKGIMIGDSSETSQYIANFTGVPIKFDTARNIFYIDVPSKYLSLPNNGGLKSVGPMGNEFNKFIPIGAGGANFKKTRPGVFLQGNIGYWAESGKVLFDSDMDKNKIKEVIIQLLVASGDNIEINIPADVEMQVIEYVYKLLMTRKPEDDITDANATVRQ